TSGVTAVSLSGDGRHALTAHRDGTLRTWEAESGRPLRICDVGGRLNAVRLGRDGRFALDGRADGGLRLWEPASGRQVHAVQAGRRRVLALDLSADGRLALSGHGDRTVALWEVFCDPTPPLALCRVSAADAVHETRRRFRSALEAGRAALGK